MSLIRKHGAVLQAWACLDLVLFHDIPCNIRPIQQLITTRWHSEQ